MPEDEAVRLDREEVDGLVLRRDALLRQIRDLDDDMEAAKVAPELYQRNRPLLVRQAAVIMQQPVSYTHLIVRHAGANSVLVQVVFGESDVRLSVDDDGRGFDVAAALLIALLQQLPGPVLALYGPAEDCLLYTSRCV